MRIQISLRKSEQESRAATGTKRETCLAAEVRARPSQSRSAASRIAGGVRRRTLLQLSE